MPEAEPRRSASPPWRSAGRLRRLTQLWAAGAVAAVAVTAASALGWLEPIQVRVLDLLQQLGGQRFPPEVVIVAIDQTADDNLAGATVAGTVTVEVSPQQVANLAQAQATGSLSLSLVGQGDVTVAEAIEVDQRALLGLEDAPVEVAQAAPPPPPTVCTVRTRRGGEVVETPVACPTN